MPQMGRIRQASSNLLVCAWETVSSIIHNERNSTPLCSLCVIAILRPQGRRNDEHGTWMYQARDLLHRKLERPLTVRSSPIDHSAVTSSMPLGKAYWNLFIVRLWVAGDRWYPHSDDPQLLAHGELFCFGIHNQRPGLR